MNVPHTTPITDSEIVLAVIRGELPVVDLTKAGVTLAVVPEASKPGRHEIIADQMRPFVVRPTLTDISHGLLAKAGDLNESHKWASLLMGADWVLFEQLEDDPDWDAILGGIWDAMFVEALSQGTLDTASRIVSRSRRFSEYEVVKLKRPQSGLSAGAIGAI